MQLRFISLLRSWCRSLNSRLGTDITFENESLFYLYIDNRVQIHHLHQLLLSLFEGVMLISQSLYLVKQIFSLFSQRIELLNSLDSAPSCACTILSAFLFHDFIINIAYRSGCLRSLRDLLLASLRDWSLKDILWFWFCHACELRIFSI